MTHEKLYQRIHELEAQVADCDVATRAKLTKELSQVVEKLEKAGVPVPKTAHRWRDASETDEIEAQFDNLPV